MARYLNNIVDRNGNVVVGANILVTTPAGLNASLYSNSALTAPKGNPLTTDVNGEYDFYAAQGTYTLTISGPGITTRAITDVFVPDADVESAAASAASALASLNDFKGRWYGPLAADPALDPLGAAIGTGDAYFNTATNLLMIYNGATWQASDINTADLAASSGSTLVGFLQSGTGAVSRTAQAKMRETVSVTDFGDGISADALQKAINTATDVVIIGTVTLDATVTLREGVRLHGLGRNISKIQAASGYAGWLFEYLTPATAAERIAPQFFALRLEGARICRMNDYSQPFIANEQEFIIAPHFEECLLVDTASGVYNAIELTKCFRSSLVRNEFQGFRANVSLHGSDIGLLKNNRFSRFSLTAVEDVSYDSFGSQNFIQANDFVLAAATATSFVKTSSRHIKAKDNYFETLQTHPAGSAIFDITGNTAGANSGAEAYPRMIEIEDNRLDVGGNQMSYFVKLGTSSFNKLKVRGNRSSKTSELANSFPAGLTYWTTTALRRVIDWCDNGFGPETVNNPPFISSAGGLMATPERYVFAPSTPGLSSGSGGATCTVEDGAFVMLYSATVGEYRFVHPNLTGTVSARYGILAKAEQAGDQLVFQVRNGTTVVDTMTVNLTTEYAWYWPYTPAVSRTAPRIYVVPPSGNGARKAYVKSIVQDMTG